MGQDRSHRNASRWIWNVCREGDYDIVGQSLPELCHPQCKEVLPQDLKNSYRNLFFLICQVNSFLCLGQPELAGLEGLEDIPSPQKVLEWLEAYVPMSQGP